MNPRRVFLNLSVFAKGYIRGRVGLFFGLVFPVILILLFGAIFSNTGNTAVDVYVVNHDHNSYWSQQFLQALNQSHALTLHVVDPSVTNLSTWLSQNDQSTGLVIPAGFEANYLNGTPLRLTVYTNPESAATSGIVQGTVQGVSNQFNLRAYRGTPIINVQNLQVGSQQLRYVDYLIPGLIGFSVLTSPMFAMVNISSEYKKQKLFRQLSLTPLSRGEWLLSTIIWFILLTLISTLLMVGVGQAAFGAHVTLTPLMLPFLILGPLLFVSLGLLAGTVSKTPESAAVIGNIITFPMMFLSGTFFPVSLFPPWLVTVAHVLPLFYVIDGLNAAMIFGNVGVALTDIAVVGALAIVFFIVSIRAFEWREK